MASEKGTHAPRETILAILFKVYDLKRIGEPFTATSLIGQIEEIEHLAETTQLDYICEALRFGRDLEENPTVGKQGGRWVLLDVEYV